MGIELPTPYPTGNGSPENTGMNGAFDTRGAETPRFSPEQGIINPNVDKNSSNYESSKEMNNGSGVADASGQPTQAVAFSTTNAQSAYTPVLDDVPVVAADEDLIEKVWVDAVKGVITRTSGDPYARSAAIGKLQEDYLQKRYGKTLGGDE